MLVLGIETSCDETAAAVVMDGRIVCSNVVASQVELHARYGGVFPEMASRQHIRDIAPVIQAAMDRSGARWDDLAAIAVTRGPGLAGSLLVGVNVAKGLSMARGLPLVGVNHMEGHLYSNWLHVDGQMRMALDVMSGEAADFGESVGIARAGPHPPAPSPNTAGRGGVLVSQRSLMEPLRALVDPWPDDPPFPHLLMTVSGGHTEIVHVRGHGDYVLLGATLDDAAGEAFDKAARMLGLGYPGGPAIQLVAADGDPTAIRFPVADTAMPLDFSFSGLKTSVLRRVQASEAAGQLVPVSDIAAGFQDAVVRALVGRLRQALDAVPEAQVVLVAGGVSANSALRAALAEAIDRPVRIPPLVLCTDNAAMIAAAGTFAFATGRRDGLAMDVAPGLVMGEK